MTRDDIIRLAQEAGVPMERGIISGITYFRFHPAIERFAALVVEREREACAELAERMDFHSTLTGFLVSPDQIADAIRARGQ
jgi:hypothetical protein